MLHDFHGTCVGEDGGARNIVCSAGTGDQGKLLCEALPLRSFCPVSVPAVQQWLQGVLGVFLRA